MNPQLLFANDAASTLAGPITNVATTITLAAGGGALFPNPGTGQAFKLTLTDAATGLIQEIMLCTTRAGDVLTVARAQEGTSALPWATGDIAANLNTAGAAAQARQGNITPAAVALTNTNHVLTAAEYAASFIGCTGTLTADCAVVFPDTTAGTWLIGNATSGAHVVTAKTASGTGVAIPQDGLAYFVWSDGVNLYLTGQAPLDSPALIGVPTAPTAAPGTNTTQLATMAALQAAVAAIFGTPTRQSVLYGPVDTNGLPNFGGATGGTTVTAAGTLIASAANGTSGDVAGTIANPSWTGLSTNGTMYLYLDIAANGTCTPGSTTLAPVYEWGGTPSVSAGQSTFNIQQMQMYVGNGTAAVAAQRVFVGQVTVAGAVVTAITWYALQGRYASPMTATLPAAATPVTFNHNLGTPARFIKTEIQFQNTTTDNGYAVGDVIKNCGTSSATNVPCTQWSSTNACGFTAGSTGTLNHTWGSLNKSTGVATDLTQANWSYGMTANRGW